MAADPDLSPAEPERETPPFGRSWSRFYTFVLCHLGFWIAVLYWITLRYRAAP